MAAVVVVVVVVVGLQRSWPQKIMEIKGWKFWMTLMICHHPQICFFGSIKRSPTNCAITNDQYEKSVSFWENYQTKGSVRVIWTSQKRMYSCNHHFSGAMWVYLLLNLVSLLLNLVSWSCFTLICWWKKTREHLYYWWLKSCTTWDVWNPIMG